MWVLTNTSNRVRLKHLCHFVSSWSYKGIYSAILKLSVFILYIWSHCSSCIKMPPLQKKEKKTFWIIRRKNRCGTEAKMFWIMRVSGRNPPAVPLRTISSEGSAVQWPRLCWRPSAQNKGAFAAHLRRSSQLRHGANKEWQFYCCLEPGAEALTSVQRCLQLTTLDVTLSACQRGPRCDLWWMRWKSGTLRARKSITFLHQHPPKIHPQIILRQASFLHLI